MFNLTPCSKNWPVIEHKSHKFSPQCYHHDLVDSIDCLQGSKSVSSEGTTKVSY